MDTDKENYSHIPEVDLKQFTRKIFEKAGLGTEDAGLLADTLVAADLRGTHSHGVMRLPFYAGRVLKGGANPRPHVRIIREDLSIAVVDGDCALGQITGVFCMNVAMEKAQKTGVGCAVARNSDHIGAAGYYAMMALKKDMIGIAWTNSYPGMAPWGGKENMICNNPLAVAVPAGEFGSVVLDMAMSVVAGGKVRLAAKKGEKIPVGWVVNKFGKNTQDPHDLPDGGALLPLGYKGYGLAVIGEIFSGVLSEARILNEIPLWFAKPDIPTGNGHFHMAIDISRFCAVETFKTRVDQMAKILKATPLMEGFQEILMPGEPETRKAEAQSRGGIAIPEPVIRDLMSVAEELDVEVPESFTRPA